MSVLIKSVEILDKRSKFHKKIVNVQLESGIIKFIGEEEPAAEEVIDAKGMKLSPGWFDLRANFNDPGLEYKEDLESGRSAAVAGGFTDVLLLPNTQPVIESKNDVKYLLRDNAYELVKLHVTAAVTKGVKGTDFTDIIDLHHAGAIAFSDGETPLYNSDILVKTLEYLQKIDGLLINRPEDKNLSMFGLMHEGEFSTNLGMKGIPSLAEEMMVIRDLKLLGYVGGKIHFANISTKESVALIREAKKQGLNVTCDVAVHQLVFEDKDLMDFDANLKVNPPYRSSEDRKALIDGLLDGTIDIICSTHSPQDTESKRLEFDLADNGVIGLQTLFPILNSIPEISEEILLDKLVYAPRKLLKLGLSSIEEGAEACLTLFDPNQKWVFDEKSNYSKSENSAYFKQELVGKVKAVFNNKKTFLSK